MAAVNDGRSSGFAVCCVRNTNLAVFILVPLAYGAGFLHGSCNIGRPRDVSVADGMQGIISKEMQGTISKEVDGAIRKEIKGTISAIRKEIQGATSKEMEGTIRKEAQVKKEWRAVLNTLPFETTATREYLLGRFTDSDNYFYNYFSTFCTLNPQAPTDFTNLPRLHIWPVYFEAYNNHWQRYRGKRVVFMEIGVQSGGKIPMLRDYFGPGLTYIGVDINPAVKKFESADWVHIEIGNSEDVKFLQQLKEKYPIVDIFLDDGGHTMGQQRVALQEMLPHVQKDGVYMCEDLSTSWSSRWGGLSMKDHRDADFRDRTMVGLIHRALDWLNAGWISGGVMTWNSAMPANFWPEHWWRQFQQTVKHIHYYNQIVVFEKGHVETPYAAKTVGDAIPVRDTGVRYAKVEWERVLARISNYTKSS